jgi:hypothetical protein
MRLTYFYQLLCLASLAVLLVAMPSQASADRLVFGSFRSAPNADNWARRLSASLGAEVEAVQHIDSGVIWYRVQSRSKAGRVISLLARRVDTAGVEFWRLKDDGTTARIVLPPPANEPRLVPPTRIAERPAAGQAGDVAKTVSPTSQYDELDFTVGLQAAYFSDEGLLGQDQMRASVSITPEYYLSWADDRQTLTFTPFLRLDSEDSERTHFDIRELFYSYIGDNWDLHVGAKRVFWGVTEFQHLVDIVNQTDLVESIDGEDKLGQPMVQFSTVQDWGIVDAYLLNGFRERSFPGDDGRLGWPFRISSRTTYESGAEQYRTDLALRWSHNIGPLEFGVHHFSGTSRDPLITARPTTGGVTLAAHYPVIDQTGVDGQAIYGDWAFKFEGISRSGYGDRYSAFNLGLEKTLVGVWDSNADLGLVAEYMHDDRGAKAVNTFFENDIALGGRLALNDFANTQALLGVGYDTRRGCV